MKFDQNITWIIGAFGNTAKLARENSNMSRTSLAQSIGISERQLRRIENEGQPPSLEIFLKIALTFQISVDEVIYLPPDNTPSTVRRQLDRLLILLSDAELEVLYSTAKGLLAVRSR